jgi:hypothetical protein
VFVVLEVGTRRILQWNVTAHPTADWTAQQFRMIAPGDQVHRFVIHDRDTIYSESVDRTLEAMGLRVLKTPVRAPQANAFCKRVIGTIRRECLDFMVPMSERHVRAILREWVRHYNRGRPPASLGPGTPEGSIVDTVVRESDGRSVLADCCVAATPSLMFVTRPAVYEEAIAWGMAGVLLTLNWVWAWQAREVRSLLPAILFAIAAANARPTTAVAGGILGLTVAAVWCTGRGEQDRAIDAATHEGRHRAVWSRTPNRRVAAAAISLSLLPGLTAAGVFWLKVRSPIPDHHLNEQMQEAPHWAEILAKNGDTTTGLIFAPTELVAYFRPDTVIGTPTWPFFDFRDPRQMMLWVPPLPSGGAYVERFASLTATMPGPWMLNVLVTLSLAVQAWKWLSRTRRHGLAWRPAALANDDWMVAVGLLASAAAMTTLTVTTVGIANRYLADFFAVSAVGVALGPRVVLPVCVRRPVLGALAGMCVVLLTTWSIAVMLALSVRLVFE